jgi:hypothetical protein
LTVTGHLLSSLAAIYVSRVLTGSSRPESPWLQYYTQLTDARIISVDNIRHLGATSKLRKLAIAPMGAVQPTVATEWLNWVTFERFDEIFEAKDPTASILTAAHIGR